MKSASFRLPSKYGSLSSGRAGTLVKSKLQRILRCLYGQIYYPPYRPILVTIPFVLIFSIHFCRNHHKAVGARFIFNRLELHTVKIWIVESFPSTKESNCTPIPHPVLNDEFWVIFVSVFSDVRQGNELILKFCSVNSDFKPIDISFFVCWFCHHKFYLRPSWYYNGYTIYLFTEYS